WWGWLAMVMLGLVTSGVPVWAEPVLNPANGHYYEAVSQSQGIGWSAARSAASRETFKGMPGHLVTIGSAQENQFLVDQFPQAVRGYFWLGGFQPRDILDPAAGWQWVTGEPWSYTHWNESEPNDYEGPGTTDQDENRLHIWPRT